MLITLLEWCELFQQMTMNTSPSDNDMKESLRYTLDCHQSQVDKKYVLHDWLAQEDSNGFLKKVLLCS